eukprot:GHVU01002829.1.p1 GENE.GHVU01002829.1~~GHVU01002829.1.p1  ORF type:complete len:197 (-),score=13.50 GHVU01002829.1:23-613(-)
MYTQNKTQWPPLPGGPGGSGSCPPPPPPAPGQGSQPMGFQTTRSQTQPSGDMRGGSGGSRQLTHSDTYHHVQAMYGQFNDETHSATRPSEPSSSASTPMNDGSCLQPIPDPPDWYAPSRTEWRKLAPHFQHAICNQLPQGKNGYLSVSEPTRGNRIPEIPVDPHRPNMMDAPTGKTAVPQGYCGRGFPPELLKSPK